MFNKSKLFFTLCTCLTVAACSDSDEDNPVGGVDNKSTGTGNVRVIHASPDAPEVNILLNGSSAIQNLDYAKSSGFANVSADTYVVSVEAITASGNAEVINVPALTITDNSKTTVMAVGTVKAEAGNDILLEAITVNDSEASPTAMQVAIRVVHASPAAAALGNVDIYVTAPGADLTAATPITLGYKQDADASAVPIDSYQIRITPNGNASTVLYDSGNIDLTAFGGQKLLIAAMDTTSDTTGDATNGAPVKLLVATDSDQLVLLDESTKVGARVLHLSPDAASAAGGPVEVFATVNGTSSVELIPAFNYTDAVPAIDSYVSVDPASYVFDVAPNTDSIIDSVYQSGALDLGKGSEYSVIASGYVTKGPAFRLLATEDDNRSVATHAKVKVVHAAAVVDSVEVYVNASGSATKTNIEAGMVSPLLDNFNFADITEYVSVSEGTYDIRVLDKTSGTVVINVENVAINNGDVITAIAYGPDESDNDPAAPGLKLLTN